MSSLDSFVTVGGSKYGDPNGPYLANNALYVGGFASGSWTGTPFSQPSSAITSAIPGAGVTWNGTWDDVKTRAISLAGLTGRMDVQGNAASSSYGAWFAHLVVAGDGPFSVTITEWKAWTNWNLMSTGTSYGRQSDPPLNTTFTVPAPGAAALALGCVRRPGLRRRFR
jgi:hypothetical protein